MPMSMYQASVPLFTNFLGNLYDIQEYAAQHFAERKVDESVVLGTRFFPDMFPYNAQIRQATQHAARCPATLAGKDAPELPEDYSSFNGLNERITAVLDFLEGLDPADFEDTADKGFKYMVAGEARDFTGERLLMGHCMPNVFFHVVTAYNLLRHNGVDLGKDHFMGYAKPGAD
jgi:uncharacterized protein